MALEVEKDGEVVAKVADAVKLVSVIHYSHWEQVIPDGTGIAHNRQLTN